MATYHAYKVTDFNRAGPPIEIEADSDSEAIRQAERFLIDGSLLLWQGVRFVITLKPQQP